MGKFDKHFKMNEEDAIQYTREILHYFNKSDKLTCV